MNNLALAIAVACALAAVGMAAWTQLAVAAMDAELRDLVGAAHVPFDR